MYCPLQYVHVHSFVFQLASLREAQNSENKDRILHFDFSTNCIHVHCNLHHDYVVTIESKMVLVWSCSHGPSSLPITTLVEPALGDCNI